MLAHLRTEAYPLYRERLFPGAQRSGTGDVSYESNLERIEGSRRHVDAMTAIAPPSATRARR